MEINYELLIGLLSIAIAIYFGLRGIPFKLRGIGEYSRKIERCLKPIEKIEETVTRIDERIDTVIRFGLKGTVEVVLRNLGKVKISAEPSKESTDYYIEIESPVLKGNFIIKKRLETDLAEKERELFSKQSTLTPVDARRIALKVPSSDPQLCREYITYFLKWLDPTYWKSLKELEEYEKITL